MRILSHSFIFMSGILVAIASSALSQTAAEPSAASHGVTATATVFPDVEKNTFFGPSVTTMVRSGVVQGYNNGSFGPDDPVTRAQVTVILDRYDQNVVQPMREQIAQLRNQLNLGRCGDGQIQQGEKCDDGNAENGDGCSATCLTEITPTPPVPPEAACGNGKCEPGEAPTCSTSCPSGNTQENCFVSCSGGTCPEDCRTPEQSDLQLQQIGGQIDAYGCYTSAGYRWCDAKQKCIRIWEEKCE
ncbi:MAG: S-layer homology domain-containing protein [Candidatus Peribacteraceae bacterium]|nr:S-layer homology domain-containing protein [Candidatus Peribacteraceae bacterium]MDD5743058.1 S-layer homology domain-containing protein [Candidatus Peribacteraceae bacterium]